MPFGVGIFDKDSTLPDTETAGFQVKMWRVCPHKHANPKPCPVGGPLAAQGKQHPRRIGLGLRGRQGKAPKTQGPKTTTFLHTGQESFLPQTLSLEDEYRVLQNLNEERHNSKVMTTYEQ